MEHFYSDNRYDDYLSPHCKKCSLVRFEYYKKYRKTLRGCVICLMGNIKYRCNNSKANSYKYYGGRGIKCCFTKIQLLDWLTANKIDPKGLECHRINNDGNYTLDNIEFLNKKEHAELHQLERGNK